MEQQSLITIQEDLAARSKKALIRGILSEAIPFAIILSGYILMLILFFAIGFGTRTTKSSDEIWAALVFGMFVGIMLVIVVAGIIKLILGKGAWNQAKAIRQDAIRAGVRRPATSIVAHIFGVSSFVAGLIVTIMGIVYASFFGLMLVIAFYTGL